MMRNDKKEQFSTDVINDAEGYLTDGSEVTH